MRVERAMRENGRIIRCMAVGHLSTKVDRHIWEISRRISDMGKAHSTAKISKLFMREAL